MGLAGLRTDDSQVVLDPTDLIVANNVNFHSSLIEKDSGSVRFNATAITGGIMAAYDWWPTNVITDRRLIVIGGDGLVYAVDNAGVVTTIGPSGSNQVTAMSPHNQIVMVAAGSESGGNPPKLFIFDGVNRPQVITSTGTVRVSLATPVSDWSGTNQPKGAILYKNSLYAWGNNNAPHQIYRSLASNHEDFGTTPTLYSVYPGDGERITGMVSFRSHLFVYKKPAGVYYLLDDGLGDPSDVTQNFFTKVLSGFGLACPHGIIEALNDLLGKGPSDAISSLEAVQGFGNVKAGDTLEIMNIAQFVRDNTTAAGAEHTHAIYYSEKKTVYFTYQSAGGTVNDRMLSVRIDTRGAPKPAWITKDRPNILALRKDTNFIERPIYGSLDGYVYLMDQTVRSVNGNAFLGEFQTPNLDFGFVDARIAGQLGTKNKIYDFLEMRYYPQGNSNIYIDVYIDQEFTETLVFPQDADALLADVAVQPNDFMLSDSATDPGGSFLAGNDVKYLRRRMTGSGRTVSFRVYNAGNDESFKIASLAAGFRASGQQEGRS